MYSHTIGGRGYRFPDLARLLGVSEASIRQAVAVLSKAGLITWRRGAGGLAYWTAKEAGE